MVMRYMIACHCAPFLCSQLCSLEVPRCCVADRGDLVGEVVDAALLLRNNTLTEGHLQTNCMELLQGAD